MFGFSWLDALLLLWLLWQLIYGLRAGLVVSLGGVAGFVAGAVGAFFAAPLVSSYAPGPNWRATFVIGATVILIALGHAVGMRVGRSIGKLVVSGPIRSINRLLGGALTLAISAVVLSMLAFGVTNLGIPVVSKQLSDSQVISRIDAWTPNPIKVGAAQLRSLVMEEGIPQILSTLDPGVGVALPTGETNTAAWTDAAQSVFKISGTAFQCGQNQTGSGFVIAPQRVMTNAHVVAGVSEPVVQTQDQGALAARVVYFDPDGDLAVLAVDGLDATPLPAAVGELPPSAAAAFIGYPLGGPLTIRPAEVLTAGEMLIPDIKGQSKSIQDVYQVAGNVQSGNSGGPLLDTAGAVVGVVFAKAADNEPVGYAFTMDEVAPVVAAAPGLRADVDSGTCTVG